MKKGVAFLVVIVMMGALVGCSNTGAGGDSDGSDPAYYLPLDEYWVCEGNKAIFKPEEISDEDWSFHFSEDAQEHALDNGKIATQAGLKLGDTTKRIDKLYGQYKCTVKPDAVSSEYLVLREPFHTMLTKEEEVKDYYVIFATTTVDGEIIQNAEAGQQMIDDRTAHTSYFIVITVENDLNVEIEVAKGYFEY